MKIFIDLGAYKGDTLETALKMFSDFDNFYAFEPLKGHFDIMQARFGNNENTFLINAAADIVTGKKIFYLGRGSSAEEAGSLFIRKKDVHKDKAVMVETVDISQFIINTFHRDDTIVLKLDIEGKEYDVLEKMLADDSICYISKLYCEWHNYLLEEISQERHEKLLSALRAKGLPMTGRNDLDEF